MLLDARGLDEKAALMKVKEILSAVCLDTEMIEVQMDSEKSARKMRGFLEMSGCNTVMERRPDHWLVRMTGRNCRCG